MRYQEDPSTIYQGGPRLGDTVYEHREVDRYKYIAIPFKVRKVSSRTFQTEDGRTWAIDKYGTSSSWNQWGAGDSYRKPNIYREAGDWPIVTRAELREQRIKEEADRKAAKISANRALLDEYGMMEAIRQIGKTNKDGFSAYHALVSFRTDMPQDKTDEYLRCLESLYSDAIAAVLDLKRYLENQGENLKDRAKRI